MGSRVAGVYEIRNTVNNKVYVGSSVNLARRLYAHRRHLENNSHASAHLQAAWDKYGGDAFRFTRLLECSKDDVLFYEQLIMDGYKANQREFGYNKRVVSESCAGMRLSDQHKAKIAASVPRGSDHQYFGKRLSDKAYLKAAEQKRGKPMPDSQRAKISLALKGKPKHAGFGKLLSAARTGVKFSAEARKNMGAKKGVAQSASAKESKGKINFSIAAEIRRLHMSGVGPHTKLAEMFGLSRGRVSTILRGEAWV